MTHLLDTDICSAHMRRPAGLAHRFFQYAGGLAMASVALAELYSGAYKFSQPARLLALIADLLQDVAVLDFDSACEREIDAPLFLLLFSTLAHQSDPRTSPPLGVSAACQFVQ
ncbi:MAG: type II toxin-antitoxin system VapC family toxin [Gemmataceae bacterium]